MISFDADGFGAHARSTYCADYLELLAWLGEAPRWGDYDEYLIGAEVRVSETFTSGALGSYVETDSDEDSADASALGVSKIRFIQDVIKERDALLGSKYPFVIEADRLKRRGDVGLTRYAGILSICHLHVVGSPGIELAFEESIRHSLVGAGFEAATLGTSAGGGFVASLGSVCATLGLVASANANARSHWARDEDADTVVCANLGDRRAGRWTMIGQVTCARSTSWLAKAKEPSRGAWGRYLTTRPDPQVFLAVPHHVPSDVWRSLLDHFDEGVVIDRLRVCAMSDQLTPSEVGAIAKVIGLGIQRLS